MTFYLFENEIVFDIQRQKIVASGQGFLEEHWQTFAELGWLAASLPEAYGGLDGTALETMVHRLSDVLGSTLRNSD